MMNTDDIILQISLNAQPVAEAFDDALASYGDSREVFSDRFACRVAQRYLEGSLSWDVASCAINCLSAWTPLENFSNFSWAIYRAFDEGEYLHPGQQSGTNEELYTRPMLHEAMSAVISREDRR
jgi:hypothetical protein